MKEEVLNAKFKLYSLLTDVNKKDMRENDEKLLNLLVKDKDVLSLQKKDRENFEEHLMFY